MTKGRKGKGKSGRKGKENTEKNTRKEDPEHLVTREKIKKYLTIV